MQRLQIFLTTSYLCIWHFSGGRNKFPSNENLYNHPLWMTQLFLLTSTDSIFLIQSFLHSCIYIYIYIYIKEKSLWQKKMMNCTAKKDKMKNNINFFLFLFLIVSLSFHQIDGFVYGKSFSFVSCFFLFFFYHFLSSSFVLLKKLI